VLEEDVEKGGLAVYFYSEEEVARGGGEFLVDETALTRASEFQSMRRTSFRGRWPSRKARALSGSEKVDLTSLSWGW
jgi:hypothetical protein